MEKIILWVGFNLFVLGLLALDLGVFHRGTRVIKLKEALVWSIIWTVLALVFNAAVYFWGGREKAFQFFTGYLIERSLSVDNIFVFLIIFSYFRLPAAYQHKVLFWGILGALVARAIFIFSGVALIGKFHWMIYVFGAFLVVTGVKMILQKGQSVKVDKNPILRLCRRFLPLSEHYDEARFFTMQNGRRIATPLFVVLLVIEATDVLFAADSIPAILAITLDPFIVYSSNVFAILGLRAMYFALAGTAEMFHYLHYGVSLVLVFVGVKMLVSGILEMPIEVTLGAIAGILLVSVVASLVKPARIQAG